MPSRFYCISYIKVFNSTGIYFAVRMHLVGMLGGKEYGLIILVRETAGKDNEREDGHGGQNTWMGRQVKKK